MNKLIFSFIITALGFFISCSPRIGGIFNRDLGVDQFEFTYLQTRARIDFVSEKQKISAGANVRIRKDSIIWMSLTPGLGVEVARVMIKKDSIYIIDKINKKYMQLSFNELSNQYDFELNYESVESILLGNLIFPYQRESVSKSEDFITYSQSLDKYQFDNYIGINTRKLEKLKVIDNDTKTVISVNYGEFNLVGEDVLPSVIKARIEYPDESKNTKLNIEYNKTKVEEKALKFPFNIPSKYRSY